MPTPLQVLVVLLSFVAWNVVLACVLNSLETRRFSTGSLLIALTAAVITLGMMVAIGRAP